ncbi:MULTISPECIES: DUF4157 domain-containing protein [Cyanophyceae]|uniref:DUF4157 domain-containing protein n=1 Tax=Leptolyngbya subtilissima DQ-A4 TaxID=2933933 RepID=A0ABV0JZI8_9CYAN|nr:DUF4157 domain-containing protein [Nodosilinea sp. FACHB-141]MBD2112569.1 DUF4157 domain-containing protein [Nodosilinea sp. FACHB-141]
MTGVLHQSRLKGHAAARTLGRTTAASRVAKQPEDSVAIEPIYDISQRPQFLGLSGELGGASSLFPIQAKLTIGQPNDKYEQEADRVASQVVQQINAPVSPQPSQGQSVQRTEAPEEEEIQAKPENSSLLRMDEIAIGEASMDLDKDINSAKGNGKALDAGLQQSMGQAMGADFSGVKVHTDTKADKLNRSIQARAFTTRQDVFFRQGAYDPGSKGGQELIAHELTHVVQQSGEEVQNKGADGRKESMQARVSAKVQCTRRIQAGDMSREVRFESLGKEQLEGLINYLETGKGYYVIDYGNEAGGAEKLKKDALARLAELGSETKNFNVRSRAVSNGVGFVFSDDAMIRNLAEDNDIWAYPSEKEADVKKVHADKFKGLELLLDQPMLAMTRYYGKRTAMRGVRENAAAGTGKPAIKESDSREVTSMLQLTAPCRRGDESVTRDVAMGGMSAYNYARTVGIEDAENNTWEWLHLVGSAIGGANKVGNLVAGTYDMNTQMIPLEKTIVEYCSQQGIFAHNPVNVTAKATLTPDGRGKYLWVAEKIVLTIQHEAKKTSLTVQNEQEMMSKFEYDFYAHVFKPMVGVRKSAVPQEFDEDYVMGE